MTPTVTAQHMVALRKANDVRLRGARFRAEVRGLPYGEGCAVLAEVLERATIPPDLGAITVDRFLRAARRLGPAQVEAMYLAADVLRRSPNRRVRELTLSERSRLSGVLRSKKPEVVQR